MSYYEVRRLGHVNLYVNDTRQTMEYYRDIIGINRAYRVESIDGEFLSNGNTHHDVAGVSIHGKAGRGKKVGLNHLGFELENETQLVAGYEAAIADGVTFERTMDHDVAHSVYIGDPDNISCEAYADVIYDWRSARNGIITKPKPVWKPGMTEPIDKKNYHVDPEIDSLDHAIFHPRKTKYATIVCSNLNESIAFYKKYLGLRAAHISSNKAFAALSGSTDEYNIYLFQKNNNKVGFHHYGIEVGSENSLLQSLELAKNKGLSIENVIDNEIRLSVILRDPDEFLVHLFVDRNINNISDMDNWAYKDAIATL